MFVIDARRYGFSVHRYRAGDRARVYRGQRARVLGCGHQFQSEKRHQLFSGVSGRGRYPGGLPRHPVRHHHKHRAALGLLRVSLSGVFRSGSDTKFNI